MKKRIPILRWEKIDDILLRENILGDFNRYDFLVKYYTIKEYLLASSNPFFIYNKMQIIRADKQANPSMHIEIFKKWITFFLYFKSSISRNIEVEMEAIPLAEDNDRIIDGSHRLSCAIYFGLEEVPVCHPGTMWGKGVEYGRKWFEKHEFNVDLLDKIKEEIIQKRKLI